MRSYKAAYSGRCPGSFAGYGLAEKKAWRFNSGYFQPLGVPGGVHTGFEYSDSFTGMKAELRDNVFRF